MIGFSGIWVNYVCELISFWRTAEAVIELKVYAIPGTWLAIQ